LAIDRVGELCLVRLRKSGKMPLKRENQRGLRVAA